jgi:hypothetical protein
MNIELVLNLTYVEDPNLIISYVNLFISNLHTDLVTKKCVVIFNLPFFCYMCIQLVYSFNYGIYHKCIVRFFKSECVMRF